VKGEYWPMLFLRAKILEQKEKKEETLKEKEEKRYFEIREKGN
jgi:hypothetical protein